jgi:hypothetical protein
VARSAHFLGAFSAQGSSGKSYCGPSGIQQRGNEQEAAAEPSRGEDLPTGAGIAAIPEVLGLHGDPPGSFFLRILDVDRFEAGNICEPGALSLERKELAS